jgi:striatin 1/3/4
MEEPISHLEQYGVRSSIITGSKQHDDGPTRPQYSMPGILHFLQTEWARFEMDRAQWEVDRAELQVSWLWLETYVFLILKVWPAE